jgi:hypothetical protein
LDRTPSFDAVIHPMALGMSHNGSADTLGTVQWPLMRITKATGAPVPFRVSSRLTIDNVVPFTGLITAVLHSKIRNGTVVLASRGAGTVSVTLAPGITIDYDNIPFDKDVLVPGNIINIKLF